MGNLDESLGKSAVGAEHTTTSAQPNRRARLGPLAAANASSSKRKGRRSDDQSAPRAAPPADFAARIAKVGATIQSTRISRGFWPEELQALHDLAISVGELLNEDPAT